MRSIAKSDHYFGSGENYWRGPVWLSACLWVSAGQARHSADVSLADINYLTLASLHNNYISRGPYAAKAKVIYDELRQAIINNMFKARARQLLQ